MSNKHKVRTAISTVTVGLLAFGGVFLTSASASAAAPIVDPKQTIGSFNDRPNATLLNTGESFNIVNLIENQPYNVVVQYALAETPDTWVNYQEGTTYTGTAGAAPTANNINIVIQDTDTTPTLKTSDRLRFTVTSGGIENQLFYTIPADTTVATAPVINFDATTVTPTQAVAGFPVTVTNLDPNKKIEVETIVSVPSGGTFTQTTVKRQYFDINEVNDSQVTFNAFGFSPEETTTLLPNGSQVGITVRAGAGLGLGNFGTKSINVTDVVTPPVDTVTPTGNFVKANPTLAELQAGTPFIINNLDPAATNQVRLYTAPASNPTNFTSQGIIPIASGSIVNGSTEIPVGVTNISAQDVIRVDLTVNSGQAIVLQTYVAPAANTTPPVTNPPVVVPPVVTPPTLATPEGSFGVSNPTSIQLMNGAVYTVKNLDSNKTNVIELYVDKKLLSTLNVPANQIEDGIALLKLDASIEMSDGTKRPLLSGTNVRVDLKVNENTPIVLTSFDATFEKVYENCDDAASKGVTNIKITDRGYEPKLDGDNDGIGCESGDRLAETGSNVAPLAGGSMALVLLGGGALIFASRKKKEEATIN